MRLPDGYTYALDRVLVSVTAAAIQPGGELGDDLEYIVSKLLFETGVFVLIDEHDLDLLCLA